MTLLAALATKGFLLSSFCQTFFQVIIYIAYKKEEQGQEQSFHA